MLNRQKDLVRLLRETKGTREDTVESQALVLMAQVGHYATCIYYAKAFPADKAAHMADLRRAIGDLVIQTQICAELAGYDWDDLFFEAFLGFRDKMKEVYEHRRKLK